eukprot:snap_masked-scaffold_97-processed-gene-0.22-mRNA-1 protein AED:1.00 eAED:1.00 QI:0/0/0/0/1/1/2/0/102
MFAGVISPRFIFSAIFISLNVVLSTFKLHKTHNEPNGGSIQLEKEFMIQMILRLPVFLHYIQVQGGAILLGSDDSRFQVGAGVASFATIISWFCLSNYPEFS